MAKAPNHSAPSARPASRRPHATLWSWHFRQLVRASGLQDSARGRGLHPTWPAGFPWLWIPLDHALHSEGVQVVNRIVGPDVGSDHYPLILDLRLSQP